uniref:hypothetical protein n=1 Tax=Enterococcus faecium TaxID=1352 RepID=UPI000C08FA20
VPLSLDDIVKRLAAAKKEMAPEIGACEVAPDKSLFVCTLSYGSARALLKAQQLAQDSHVKVLVETRGRSLKPQIAIGCILIAVCVLLDVFFVHPKGLWEWLFGPICIALFVAIQVLFVPLSKQVLERFVRDIILSDPQE